jgi:hypothetical protein
VRQHRLHHTEALKPHKADAWGSRRRATGVQVCHGARFWRTGDAVSLGLLARRGAWTVCQDSLIVPQPRYILQVKDGEN